MLKSPANITTFLSRVQISPSVKAQNITTVIQTWKVKMLIISYNSNFVL